MEKIVHRNVSVHLLKYVQQSRSYHMVVTQGKIKEVRFRGKLWLKGWLNMETSHTHLTLTSLPEH